MPTDGHNCPLRRAVDCNRGAGVGSWCCRSPKRWGGGGRVPRISRSRFSIAIYEPGEGGLVARAGLSISYKLLGMVMAGSDYNLKACPSCGICNPPEVRSCSHCGEVFPVNPPAQPGTARPSHEPKTQVVDWTNTDTWGLLFVAIFMLALLGFLGSC